MVLFNRDGSHQTRQRPEQSKTLPLFPVAENSSSYPITFKLGCWLLPASGLKLKHGLWVSSFFPHFYAEFFGKMLLYTKSLLSLFLFLFLFSSLLLSCTSKTFPLNQAFQFFYINLFQHSLHDFKFFPGAKCVWKFHYLLDQLCIDSLP